jgi:hypothetical protein
LLGRLERVVEGRLFLCDLRLRLNFDVGEERAEIIFLCLNRLMGWSGHGFNGRRWGLRLGSKDRRGRLRSNIRLRFLFNLYIGEEGRQVILWRRLRSRDGWLGSLRHRYEGRRVGGRGCYRQWFRYWLDRSFLLRRSCSERSLKARLGWSGWGGLCKRRHVKLWLFARGWWG